VKTTSRAIPTKQFVGGLQQIVLADTKPVLDPSFADIRTLHNSAPECTVEHAIPRQKNFFKIFLGRRTAPAIAQAPLQLEGDTTSPHPTRRLDTLRSHSFYSARNVLQALY